MSNKKGMKNSDKKEKYILLDNLFNLFLDSQYQEEDKELLKESDIDIDQIVQKNILLFRQLKTQAKAELYEAKHNRVLNFISEIKTGLDANIEKYKKIADDIFATPKFAKLQPMFRNLGKVSENDKKSILMDSKLLDLLSDIEEDYNIQDKNE